tara:strand:+ start:256 stop:396 length:141 start_codon:yes stop_codon:yes gene_type:complete
LFPFSSIIWDFCCLEQIFPILEIFMPKDLEIFLMILDFEELAVNKI